jgi:hypothetical protein
MARANEALLGSGREEAGTHTKAMTLGWMIVNFKIKIAMAHTVVDSLGHLQASKAEVNAMHCWPASV